MRLNTFVNNSTCHPASRTSISFAVCPDVQPLGKPMSHSAKEALRHFPNGFFCDSFCFKVSDHFALWCKYFFTFFYCLFTDGCSGFKLRVIHNRSTCSKPGKRAFYKADLGGISMRVNFFSSLLFCFVDILYIFIFYFYLILKIFLITKNAIYKNKFSSLMSFVLVPMVYALNTNDDFSCSALHVAFL